MSKLIAEYKFYEAIILQLGWCLRCDTFTAKDVSLDAKRGGCPSCEFDSVIGAEDALIRGFVEFLPETERRPKNMVDDTKYRVTMISADKNYMVEGYGPTPNVAAAAARRRWTKNAWELGDIGSTILEHAVSTSNGSSYYEEVPK